MATPPTQCPCGLTREEVKEYKKVNPDTMLCTAPRKDNRAETCGELLVHHPHESAPLQGQSK